MRKSLRRFFRFNAALGAVAVIFGAGCASMNEHTDLQVGPMLGVLLDPGHGGQPGRYGGKEDCYGAISADGFMEKTATLAVAEKVRSLIEKQGIPCAMTRTDDRFVSLDERAAMANRPEYQGWVFVSIHFNRSQSKQKATNLNSKYRAPHGFEIYIVPPAGSRSSDGHRGYATINYTRSANLTLAQCLETRLETVPEMKSRGIKQAWFMVLRENPLPGVLIEGGFLSNPQESGLIETEEYQWSMARAIVSGITDYQMRHATFALK